MQVNLEPNLFPFKGQAASYLDGGWLVFLAAIIQFMIDFMMTPWRFMCKTLQHQQSQSKILSIHHGHIIQHDDVIKWKYFLRYWPFVDSPHKCQWHEAMVFSLKRAWKKQLQTIETPVIWDAMALIVTSL